VFNKNNMTSVINTISEVRGLVRQARAEGKRIGLVPTMGALHAGHISLVEAAKKQTDFVVVSIFVNPTQFGPNEDFAKYPRTLDADVEMCQKAGADVVFSPSADEMYPSPQQTWVDVEKLTDCLCGASRPGHFRGVTTVCTKLFNIVLPDVAFFGQKDAQQGIIIKRMVADLNMPLDIVICPIIREANGLAMSSRNKYLSEQQKHDAAAIYAGLRKAEQMIKSGQRDPAIIIAAIQEILKKGGSITTEYIHIVDAATLADLQVIKGQALIAIAAKVGSTRLIDNILIDASV
jgi:pantoate--beta-alanine ligase